MPDSAVPNAPSVSTVRADPSPPLLGGGAGVSRCSLAKRGKWRAAGAAEGALLAFAFLTLAVSTPAHAQSAEQVQVAATLDTFHAAAARADGAAYFALFAPDGVFIGTDVHERWTVADFKAYAQPFFARGKGWVYKARERHVTLAPGDCRCVAWFDEVLDSQSYGTARGTGALVKVGDGWKVAQYALSFPIPNDLADGFTKEIKAYEARPKP